MHGIASIVNYHFNQEQRLVLLGWLFDIAVSMCWNPRPYWNLLHSRGYRKTQPRREPNLRSKNNRAN
jgi:hypothetical protein